MQVRWSCSQAVSKTVWHVPLLCVQWKTPDDWQRNCLKHVEFHSKNKFQKLVHLVGFIIRNFITMHGHMNINFGIRNGVPCTNVCWLQWSASICVLMSPHNYVDLMIANYYLNCSTSQCVIWSFDYTKSGGCPHVTTPKITFTTPMPRCHIVLSFNHIFHRNCGPAILTIIQLSIMSTVTHIFAPGV